MSNKPSILVLATGGTIAGRSSADTTDSYISGTVSIDKLLCTTLLDKLNITVQAEQIAAIGSQDMDATIWQLLYQRISTAFTKDKIDAVVITHGTDTLEETAFLLELTMRFNQPVVLVGAMRPADALGSDAPRVLLNAIRVASDKQSCGRGVLVISGDNIVSSYSAYKANTNGTDGISSYPAGPLGVVSPSYLYYFYPPIQEPLHGSCIFPTSQNWATVPIIYVCANMDASWFRRILDSDIDGIVLAGVGHGNAPLWLLEILAQKVKQGIPVVRATRLNMGTVLPNIEVNDTQYGFIAGYNFNPQKCRLLLQLLLYQGITQQHLLRSFFVMRTNL